MSKQKTSVEWLALKIIGLDFEIPMSKWNQITEYVKQAKTMEKERLKECWDVAHQAGRFEGKGIAEENWQTFEQYYNENYEKQHEDDKSK